MDNNNIISNKLLQSYKHYETKILELDENQEKTLQKIKNLKMEIMFENSSGGKNKN